MQVCDVPPNPKCFSPIRHFMSHRHVQTVFGEVCFATFRTRGSDGKGEEWITNWGAALPNSDASDFVDRELMDLEAVTSDVVVAALNNINIWRDGLHTIQKAEDRHNAAKSVFTRHS